MKRTAHFIVLLQFFLLWQSFNLAAQANKHTFALAKSEFLLDGKPFQIRSGEIHPARIPKEYWRHRLQMAKAMGCNATACYIFWNYHETAQGVFDFASENRNIAEFLKIAQEEKLWVLFRPGPYVCGEWEFGGLPPYLLQTPDIKIRCMDKRYMDAVKKYFAALAKEVKPYLITNGGNIILWQVENEYGSYGNDKNYLEALRTEWTNNGIDVPFYTADGATPYMLDAGSLPGAAIGLDSGGDEKAFEQASLKNPEVPSFSSESYPGWLTHWGEQWARPDKEGIVKEIEFLLKTKRSFNLYVIHGGTNFGFTAGANSGGKGYEPDITSYDYDAPINENGNPTPKYFALREAITKHTGSKTELPKPIPTMKIPPIEMTVFSSVWNNLPKSVFSVQPKPMEAYKQDYGFILYQTKLIGHKSGTLTVTDLHDYASVFLNGKFIGTMDRRLGENSINIPKSDAKDPTIEILAEGMGRINFAQSMIDRKGITERVTLNGMTLMNWEVYNLPFDNAYIKSIAPSTIDAARRGTFFKGKFTLKSTADVFINMSAYKKGMVWVNGHNLGRYWEIGPQKKLYCPAPWLSKGENEIIVFDQLQNEAKPIEGDTSH